MTLNVRRMRGVLWTAGALLAVGSALAAAAAVFLPCEAPPADPSGRATDGPGQGGATPVPGLGKFSSVWEMDLRRPVYDVPVKPPPEKPRPNQKRSQSHGVAGAPKAPGYSTPPQSAAGTYAPPWTAQRYPQV